MPIDSCHRANCHDELSGSSCTTEEGCWRTSCGKTLRRRVHGDVHFSGFQYLQRVEQACGHPVDTWPGISSAQVVASRGKVCFDETTFITFHRRGDIEPFKQHLVHVLDDQRNAIVTPRPWDFMPKDIACWLL